MFDEWPWIVHYYLLGGDGNKIRQKLKKLNFILKRRYNNDILLLLHSSSYLITVIVKIFLLLYINNKNWAS